MLYLFHSDIVIIYIENIKYDEVIRMIRSKRIGIITITIFSCIAVILCALMLPGRAYAVSGASGISDEWVYTLAYQKKLDLSEAGLDIKLTSDEKAALKKQAEDEYYDEVDHVFGGVVKDAEEFEQSSGIPLKIDGKYNPAWDAAWNEAHPSYENDLYASCSDYFKLDIHPNTDNELYKKLGGDSLSRYRLYLRLNLMSYLAPVNYSKISSFDDWKEGTIKWGYPINKTGDTQATIRHGWGNVGSTEWFARVYDYFKGTTGDEDLTEAVDYMKDGYVYARYAELESELLSKKIGNSLKDVKFDFYVENVPESQQDKYGIGTKYTRSDADYTVEAGSFNADSDGNEPDSVFLSTVDFGSSDQYYDEDLTEKVQDARSLSGTDRSSAIKSLYSDIGGTDLGTHLVLYDGASYESYSYPHLLRAGTFTNNGSMIWPYASGSAPFQGGKWNFESLAKYNMFSGRISRTSGTRRRFSFYNDMAYTGINWASRSGYDLYFPEFDSDGNLISISKPLINGIVEPTQYGEIVNPVYDQITDGKADGEAIRKIEYGDYSYGNFDQLTFKNQLKDADDAYHTIRRYIVKEKSSSSKINGKNIRSDTDELILDVTPAGQIMIFDTVDQADAFYEDYDLQVNTEHYYWSPRFTKVKASRTDDTVYTVPSATYSNVTEEPKDPDPVVVPEADVSILVRLDGYDADKSMIDQSDMTQFGLTLYNAADASTSNITASSIRTSSFIKGSKIKDIAVDKDGSASLTGLEPGKYVLVETKYPDGTKCVQTQYDLEIKNVSGRAEVWFNGTKIEDGENAIVENEISKLSVEKKDVSGSYVSDADLAVVDDETGETVDSWTTSREPHTIAALKYDHKYTLREESVPKGYRKASDITFSITSGSVKKITMIDKVKAESDKNSDSKKDTNSGQNSDTKKDTDSGRYSDTKRPVNSDRSVKTGDASGLYTYLVLFIVSVLAAAAVIVIRRRSRD